MGEGSAVSFRKQPSEREFLATVNEAYTSHKVLTRALNLEI